MRQACATTLFCLALLATGALGADVLVTTDGSVVETDGPWQQRGKMVVFTLANGQLSALRAEDVDFEATERWRAELDETAQGSAPQAPAEAPKARIVLTDADVAHVTSELEPGASGEAPEGEAAGAAASANGTEDPNADPATQSPVRVIAWDQDEPADGRGRRVFGTLRNDGNGYATDISVQVTVYDNEGAVAGTQTATPIADSLRPGESTLFSLQFTEVFIIGATRFAVGSLDLDLDGEEGLAPEL